MTRRPILAAALALAFLVGCSGSTGNKATDSEQNTSQEQLTQFLVNQPIPRFNTSQLRQNLIEIETAQANATATTTFFFNQGVQDPIASCPSIGFPIPATYQLSNPSQVLTPGSRGRGTAVIDQLESTGVYTGDTTGTYIICVDDTGDAYTFYWEGFVSTITGPGSWNTTTHQVELTGKPTAEFSTGG